jgi:hypothetical protein
MVPLKAVLLGIRSHEVIEFTSPYISETFGPALRKKLRKQALENMYEVYFLLLELSDSLAADLYSSKLVKRATRRCRASTALFPVHFFMYGGLILVTMYFTVKRVGGIE